MARKKQGGLAELVLCGLFFAICGLIAALPYIVTLAFYALPLLLIYFAVHARAGKYPALQLCDDEDTQSYLRDLRKNRSDLFEEIDGIIEYGREAGVRYLDREDRFENRSKRGQELNLELERKRSLLADVEERTAIAEDPRYRAYLVLEEALAAWYRARAYLIAGSVGISTLIGTILLIELRQNGSHERLSILVWNPAPHLLLSSFAFGAVAMWIVTPLVLVLALRWSRRAAEAVYSSVISQIPEEDACDPGSESDTASEYTQDELADDPYKVLGINVSATVAEIKAAYRSAIKLCHPDTVADRSVLIKEAAAQEAMRLNLAYESLRAERGF
ncbi:J domain-containing protein [Bradyrhizobium sp. 62]|uniref:J domain-containing protein n=1 Tax=Bradyrhizobium sp. 62 TaxID=1043588 RepID=UPI001FF91475|nr:J domain-containing protein [Bradyrhizobium sp. 62]MCK1367235.1 J domain-containing protein [Bradyrhizobium sp. 62]